MRINVTFPQDPLFEGCSLFWSSGQSQSVEGTRKVGSTAACYEEQMMSASRLYVSPVIDMDCKHLSVKITKPPIYPG